MKKNIISIFSLFLTGILYAQTNTENYIRTRAYLDSVTISSPNVNKIETVQYFNGLGKEKQTVNVKASPMGRDLVTPIVYDAAGRQNGGIKKRESNSDCQSINAGSDSHEKKFLVVQTRADGGVLGLILLAGESLPQHIAADEHQQDEGDPVVKALDSGRELRAQHPADKRHKRLKAAEIQSHRQGMAPSDFRHGQALTHRHRKGVHR